MADDPTQQQSTDDLTADALASDAGVTARFSLADVVFHVAPSVATRANTLRRALRPSACWRMDDSRFHFDSSFILPEASTEFALLRSIRTPDDTTGLLTRFHDVRRRHLKTPRLA